jgi:uncharacterized protein
VVADRLPALTYPLRAVGALALSVYTAQIVVLWALLQVDPFRPQGVGLWLMFTVSALVGAGLWWWKLGRGPLERLLTWSSTRAAAVTSARQP